MNAARKGAYGADDGLVDFILGITFEIWEQGGVELIHQYYAPDCAVFTMDGLAHGAEDMVRGTRTMLQSFPDRRLIGDDVIWSGSPDDGFYSSHRITSPMTNTGVTPFGPATDRSVRIMNVADCVVENGKITREWLVRDNLALITQLGFDPIDCAAIIADREQDDLHSWIASEIERLRTVRNDTSQSVKPSADATAFAASALYSALGSGDTHTITRVYAPYAHMYRSPVELHAGREAIAAHYAAFRSGFALQNLSVDHIAVQPADSESIKVAVRWTAAMEHCGDYYGIAATQKTAFVLGITHWRIVEERIATEWTVFDRLALMSQLL